MGSPTAPEGTRRYGASERPQSYLSPCDGHSIHDTNKQIPEEFTYPDCPDVRIPDCGELASNGIAHGNIEREFLDENHHTKERELFDTESIKQEPAIKQEVRFEDGKTFIDLTKEETSALPRRPMPNAKLIKAVYRHQKAEMRRLGPRQQESDSLFVQDNDPPRSMPNSAWLTPEPGEDDDSNFMEFQTKFKSLVSPSVEEQIEFQRRKQLEIDQRRKIRIDQSLAAYLQTETVEGALGGNIFSDQQLPPENSGLGESGPAKELEKDPIKLAAAKLKATRLTKLRIKRARNIALDVFFKKGLQKQDGSLEDAEQQIKPPQTKGKGKSQAPRQPTTLSNKEIRSIFENDSGYRKGRDPLLSAAVSTAKNKRKAFAEMIASIPTTEKAQGRTDIAILDEATRTFNPSARSDGQGRWKIRGLKTPLMVNQTLAAAWMCKRETCESKPDGGLLCDVMGFGKTLSALACIVNRKVPYEPEGPTLIVAPRNLMLTWLSQIRQHCVHGAAGSIVGHYSGAHVETDNLADFLRVQGIVITTYQEIVASYPVLKPPPELENDTDIEDWWEKHYAEEAGAFHQIHWHRIILDEAHIIRNRKTRTSVAVRALSGNFKWALTGTPLLNCVEEFYSLFAFIGVPSSHLYQEFRDKFCDGTKQAKERLINVLRAIIHRKTHESRHLGRPLIEMKKFTMKEVTIEFYPPEKLIYNAIAARFLGKLNDTEIKKQTKCIFTMILKLQMFTSHPLTAQDYLQKVCKPNSPLITQLKTWVKEEISPGNPSPSSKIVKCCLAGTYQTKMPMVPLNAPSASENPRPRPRGNCKKLAERFRMEIKELMNQGQFYECDNRTWFCPSCQGLPTRAIITSCHHIYCEECFDSLDDGNGNSSGIIRECCICRVVITKAAFYGLFDDINSPTPGDSEADSDKPDGQKKRKAPHKEAKTHKRRRQGKSGTSFSEWTALNSDISMQDDSESESEDDQSGDSESTRETDDCSESGESQKSEEDSKEEDWMAKFGKSMPGAKFDAVRDQIQKWFAEDSTAKIVIFTLYLNTTKLLVSLCDQNNWKHARITGIMSQRSRESQLNSFSSDAETKIMIASLKTGGLGLDFSKANKCILTDLWWNESVQDQAFFRLWRLGQERDVECVLFMVKGSIDEWMSATQKRKAVEISQVMSIKVLTDRNTLRELLEMFGEVTYDPKCGFRVTLAKRATRKDKSIAKAG